MKTFNVIKRNDKKELLSYDKILERTKKLGDKFNLEIQYSGLVVKIIDQLYDNIKTCKIDELMAEQCASMGSIHYDYSKLAGYICISNHHKETKHTLRESVQILSNQKGYLSDKYCEIVEKYHNELEQMMVYERNYLIDYFGYKTLERSYLMRYENKVIENIQHLWMRVSIQIHGENLVKIKETYDGLSKKLFIHATPTLYNSGTSRPQLSSCYLLGMEDDSIDGIFNTLHECASISKWAGGIGLHIHNIRSKGTHILGTNGTSNGIVPMLRVFNNTARYVDQGGGKRNGSFAMYLEPWHGDIVEFLELRKNHGEEEMRARDLFYALWIPDLFMHKIEKDEEWYLMCPNQCKGLSDVYGTRFTELYEQYVREGKFLKKLKARELWFKILDSQMETGTPYMLYKDACNEKSNQKNLGTIRSSNLCCEIMEYSDKDESAVCNLASISLSSFVKPSKYKFKGPVKVYTKDNCKWCELLKNFLNKNKIIYSTELVPSDQYSDFIKEHKTFPQLFVDNEKIGGFMDTIQLLSPTFDYKGLHKITKVLTENLNKIIDVNYYPTEKTRLSNMKHRPIGIGVQGLADTFAMLNLPFDSEEAKEVNIHIFETMYHASMEKSMELARETKKYETFDGSPLSKGIFQFDMWNVKPSNRYNWDNLRKDIMTHGTLNSLCLAPMPTASTSQILANNECFEPFTSNMYSRRTLAGEFMVINKHLMKELIELNLWNSSIKNDIVKYKGSIQSIPEIPDYIKAKYKIVWEMSMKNIIDMSKDRGAFICQSQSMNLWVEDPNYKILTNMHLYAWKAGLKTGMYYLRRKAKHQAQQFTVVPDKEDCLMCGS
jgi:ribonucleoside-diphosphate reductase alpha subunit